MDSPEALVLELVSGAGNKVHLQRERALARLEEALMRNDGEPWGQRALLLGRLAC